MYSSPPKHAHILIVGAGCFGLSTAYALSLDKEKHYRITMYDRGESVPVSDAASTDISKVVRIDYGHQRLYTDLGIEAIDAWHAWNKEVSEPLFHQVGVLAFSSGGEYSPLEKDNLKTIEEAGYGDAIERLTASQIKQRYPFLSDTVNNGYDIAYFNKLGGWCNSSEAIKHLYAKCVQNNVEFVLGKETGCFTQLVTDPHNTRSVIGIKTKDGLVHYADRVIIAAGPWTSSLIEMHHQVMATGQIVVHFQLSEKEKQQLKDLPNWSGDVSRTGFYGFPYNKDGILKVGKHARGYLHPRPNDGISVPRTQSSHPGDTIPQSALDEFRDFLDAFLPITTALDIVYSRVCWYSDSIDGDFVIGCHPDYDDLVVAAGDSGHAMK
ncbi:FAD dependent oxidoreductase [Gilbertella persicaria]|uniref:FAD dependent oxidoreductase n=1 Tax=Gilbertella persicaria TaxID=101096 RepID=UPI00221E4BB3|nr:FAD dependent oxidoreductase [Gilbertella persicaria]KAI8077341.1 FAD dependent oxidoreductase [Gilbertella persicaria]